MNLYEIDQKYKQALDACLRYSEENEGVVADGLAEELEQFCDSRESKIENVALYIKKEVAISNAIGAEIKELQKRKKSHDSKANWLKLFVGNFCKNGFESAKVKISWRKSQLVSVSELLDIETLDSDYLTVKTTVNKTALKNAIKTGVTIEGVEIVDSQNIQIK